MNFNLLYDKALKKLMNFLINLFKNIRKFTNINVQFLSLELIGI